MVRLALLFLVMALVAGLFGFGLVASLSVEEARILFFVLLGLAVVTFVASYPPNRSAPHP